MSFYGNLDSYSPEFLASLNEAPAHNERKPVDPPTCRDDDGINPIAAVIAYELLSQSSDAVSDTSADFSSSGND